jgi:hypothetical protein
MWIVRKLRRLFGHCPWCGQKMVSGQVGLFLNGWLACPDNHYAEEMVICAGGAIIVYEDGGKPLHIDKGIA